MLDFNFNPGSFKNQLEKQMYAAAQEQLKDHFKKKLRPYESRIRAVGGQIKINVPKNLKNISINITKVPDDLKAEIEKALNS